MNRTHTLRALGAAALSVALAGCAALDTATGPRTLTAEQVMSADVAVSAGAGIAEDVSLLLLNEQAIAASAPGGSESAASARIPGWSGSTACGYDSGARRYQCPALTRDGLTLTRSYAFLDTAGAPQAGYDPKSTSAAEFRVGISGAVTRDDWSAGVQRSLSLAVTGLSGAQARRTWNGTGSRAVGGAGYTSRGGTRRYELAEADTLAAVVILPRSEYPWPVSGTAVRHVSGTMTNDGSAAAANEVQRTVRVTFNGSGIVPLDSDGSRFWLNLTTGRVVPRE